MLFWYYIYYISDRPQGSFAAIFTENLSYEFVSLSRIRALTDRMAESGLSIDVTQTQGRRCGTTAQEKTDGRDAVLSGRIIMKDKLCCPLSSVNSATVVMLA